MKFGSVSIFASVSLGVYALLGCGQVDDQRDPVRASQAQSSNYQSSGLVGDEALKIISTNCISCHGAGQELDLTDMNVIKMKAPAIEGSILSGEMPKGSPLSAEDMAVIDAWAKAGYPLGAEASSGSKDPGSKDPGGKGEPKPEPKPPVPPTKPDHPGQSDCTSQSKCDDYPSQSSTPKK